LPPVEIVRRALVDQEWVSRSLRTLEAKTLMERPADPEDSRATRVSLTRKGRQILEESRRYAHVYAFLLMGIAGGLLQGCVPKPTDPQITAPAAPFLVKTTIREIMDAEVDPAADALWNAVSFTATLQGQHETRPETPEAWQAVRRNAITLLAATNLILIPGRRIAPADMAPAPGELDPAILQRKLETNNAQFAAYAQVLRGLTLQAIDAIDAKDAQKLFELGGAIDSACEACHLVFWYPPAGGAAPPQSSPAESRPDAETAYR